MEVSAQQYRAVSGCFTARMWSSDWTSGSSGKARCNWRWHRRKRQPTTPSTFTTMRWGCTWLLLLTNFLVTALHMIVVPVAVISVTESFVNISAMKESDTGTAIGAPNVHSASVTSTYINHPYMQLELLLSGDVETNPGPLTAEVTFENRLVEGLAKLCRAAPSDEVRKVLGVWSPGKPGNEIRNTWQHGKGFLAPALKGTLAWLTNCRESDVKGTKHDVAGQLLIALEALLPDTCQVCKEVYTIEREDTPSMRCKGCSQGFHQTCYDRLEVGPSLAELPGEFSWLCTVCAPLYQLTTVVGSSRGQERPRLSSRCPPTLPVSSASQSTQDGGGEDLEVPEPGPRVEPAPPPPPPPPTEPVAEVAQSLADQDVSDCLLYLSGECPFGISGRTGGICPNKHPKRCMTYMRWGNRNIRGCSGITCGKAHPKLCPKSLDLKCFDSQCPFKLHTHRCLRSEQGWRQPGARGSELYTPLPGGRIIPGAPVWSWQEPHRSGYPDQWGPGQQPWQVHDGVRPRDHRGPGQQVRQGHHPTSGAVRVPHHGIQSDGAGNNPYFQGLTAQQNLLGAIEQQLQQAVSRAIMQALSGSAPVQGAAEGGRVPPSF